MDTQITFYDKDYKKVCSAIGWSLVIFVVLFGTFNELVPWLADSLSRGLTNDGADTVYSLLEIAAYLSSFLIPSFLLTIFLRSGKVFERCGYSLRIERRALWLIPATITVALVVSYINSMVMSYFGVDEAYNLLLGGDAEKYAGYQIVLLYISGALVPAFCEELFFRGRILANLMPYGKTGAVIISAILFALMHQNPYQLLYTAAAGIMLGMVYIKTGSIWLCTVIHFVNNAYSVTIDVLYANVGGFAADLISLLMFFGVIGLGIFGLVRYLVLDKRARAKRFDGGFFGKDISLGSKFAEKPISKRYRIKGFFRASVIIYIILCVLTMAILLLGLVLITATGGSV